MFDLTEGGGHTRVHGGLSVSGGKVQAGEVSALVVVVLHIQAGQLGELHTQSAARVIDVLAIQSLERDRQTEWVLDQPIEKDRLSLGQLYTKVFRIV